MIKNSLKIEEYPPKKTFFEKIKAKIKTTGEFLKDFFFEYSIEKVRYIYKKCYKIQIHWVCDLFPIYILPQFAIYKGARSIWISLAWLFFRIDIDFISLLW